MSSHKTENYQLHTWAAGDDFLRSEFNANFEAIDSRMTRMAAGAYTGDGEAERVIELGFTPRAVFVLCDTGDGLMAYSHKVGGLAVTGLPVMEGKYPALTITDSGFQVHYVVGDSTARRTNTQDWIYHYVALA